ncbi:MAG: D-arabinono-1,4-lactone oxidase [Sinimarinibacterium sp.]
MSRRRTRTWVNWSGTVRCEPAHCAHPVTIEEIQSEVVRVADEGERLRVIGGGHSFSPLCWTDDNHLSLDRFTGIESADLERQRVWVRAGTRLQRLTEALADRGLALENAPDFDQQTLAGALATGTHGSGAAFGNIGSLVTGLRMVCADGSVHTLSADQDADLFRAAVVSLGALGIVTHVELQCVDDYRLELLSQAATLGETLTRIDAFRRDHRNSEFFWFPYTDSVVLRTADVTREQPTRLSPIQRALRRGTDRVVFRSMAETARRAPRIAEQVGRFATRVVSGRRDVLSARHAYALQRRLRFQQLEFALPVNRVAPVLRSLDRVIKALAFRIHFPVEVRFVAGDDNWLSPHYGRDSACVSVPAYPDMSFEAYFAPIAELMERNDGRPHWAMLHDLKAEQLRALYPRFDDFCALRRRCDPRGLFLNPHLAAILGEELR